MAAAGRAHNNLRRTDNLYLASFPSVQHGAAVHGKLGSLAALSEMQLNRIDMQSPARQSTHTSTHTGTHTCVLYSTLPAARARRTSTPVARPSPSAVFTDVGTEHGLKALKGFS